MYLTHAYNESKQSVNRMPMLSRLALSIALLPLAVPAAAAPPHRATDPSQNERPSTADSKPASENVKDANGVVAEATCSGAAERIELKTSKGTLHLRGPAEGGIGIDASSLLPKDFNACTSLKGLSVSVQYKPDNDQSRLERSNPSTSLRLNI